MMNYTPISHQLISHEEAEAEKAKVFKFFNDMLESLDLKAMLMDLGKRMVAENPELAKPPGPYDGYCFLSGYKIL